MPFRTIFSPSFSTFFSSVRVAVVFTPNDAYIPDETQQEGEEGAEGGVQHTGEQGAEGEEGEGGYGDQFGAEPFLAFEVQVESLKNATTGRLIVDLDIDVYGQIHVNGYRFSENRDATEITEEVSKGLESFITQLGVDTELVAYIWSYCRVHHDKSELERLQDLQKFLSK
jgi:hypothetical protein